MPCAEGELCQLPDTTPQDPHGHGCQGGCGGRLHGICGSVVDDGNENHRIYLASESEDGDYCSAFQEAGAPGRHEGV